jgi:hypothetical protein
MSNYLKLHPGCPDYGFQVFKAPKKKYFCGSLFNFSFVQCPFNTGCTHTFNVSDTIDTYIRSWLDERISEKKQRINKSGCGK